MKKVLAIALTLCLMLSCILMANATVEVTTFEDEGDVSMLGYSVNNRVQPGSSDTSIYKWRYAITNSWRYDDEANQIGTTNFIIEEENGNKCVKFTAPEAWHSDCMGDAQACSLVSIDLNPTTVTGLAGVFAYGDPYNDAEANLIAGSDEAAISESGYMTVATGMTIGTDLESVVIFIGSDATYTVKTGDLSGWHTYAAYIEENVVTYAIDQKVVATVEGGDGTLSIYDINEEEQDSTTGSFYTADPRCGFMITGEGMEILGDNLTWEEFEEVPTEKYPVEGVEVSEETEAPAEETEAVEETEAPAEETDAVEETEAVVETEAPAEETAAEEEKSGCGSVVMSGAAVVMMAACALVLKKKEL